MIELVYKVSHRELHNVYRFLEKVERELRAINATLAYRHDEHLFVITLPKEAKPLDIFTAGMVVGQYFDSHLPNAEFSMG